MTSKFEVIGIFGKVKKPGVGETLRALIALLRSLNQSFVVEAETAASLNDASLALVPRAELANQCQLLIVVGGDGSLLHAAQHIIDKEIPVLGINRGRLGFLTDILPGQLDKIKAILAGDFIKEKRLLLSATANLNELNLGHANALNEVALIPNCIPRMNQFEIYIDDEFLCSQDSDGLIIATPTGSTAYALSGGGPILHPELEAIVIVPMFSHTLTIRPIVISAQHRIGIVISGDNNDAPRLACDGRAFINTPPHTHITVQRKANYLHLIHPLDYNYYQTLRTKLHWGRKLNYVE